MFTFRSLVGGVVYDLPSAASISMGFELSDISGATIKYPVNGVNADRVVEDATIIAYYNGTEIKGGRWWLQGTTGEEAIEDVVYKTIAGKNLFTIFEKAVVHTSGTSGKKTYTARTPGYILNDLFTAAQARGAMTGITWDFTATLDSEGQAWPDAYDISYSITDTYLKIVQGMFDNAWAEFGFNGTVFQATKPFQYGADLSNTVELIAGRDYLELPYKTSIEDRIHYALVAGDEGTQANYYAAGATGPYGREEAGATQGGVQGATLSIFAFNMVRDNNKNARENTRKVIVGGATPIPGVAFNVGDTITERITVTPITSRVKAMALGVDQYGNATASIVVGDRILDSDIAAARARNALSGSVRSTGGTGTVTPPTSGTVADTNTPSAPTALAGFTDGYLDGPGNFRAYVSLTWTPPTTNTDASTITDLAGYEVQWRPGTSWSSNWAVARVTDATLVVPNLEPDLAYSFRVRALDNASPPHLSAFTSTLTVTTAKDNIAPPTPKAPTVLTTRGQAILSWNGKSSADASMGVDFSRVDIHRSLVNNFTPDTSAAFTTRVGQLAGPDFHIFSDQVYGTVYYYKLVAYDHTGNMSPASAQVSATTAPLVSSDLSTGVAGNKITVSATAPSSPTTGDQWIDTANGNIIKIWTGSAWTAYQDTDIAAAQTAANTAQTTANGKNSVTYSTSTPGSTANVVDDVWFQHASNQVIGQWLGLGGTSWQAVTLRNEVIATLDAAKITTGFLDVANRIQSASITTQKLIVGNTANMAEISEDVAGTVSWAGPGPWTSGIAAGWATRVGTKDTYFMFRNQKGPVPFNTGERIRITFEAYASAAISPSLNLWVYGDANASQGLGGTAAITTTPQTFTFEANITVTTALKTAFLIGLNHANLATTDVYLRNVRAYVMNAGELIVDGSITANDLAAGSVIAGKVAANVITTTELAANAVEADNILAGAVSALKLSADAIDGKVITGATLRTAAAGERIEIIGGTGTTDNEIRFHHSATGGDVTTVRTEDLWGNPGSKAFSIDTPVKWRPEAEIPAYQNMVINIGDQYKLGTTTAVAGMSIYVLADESTAGWTDGSATPTSWIIMEDDEIYMQADGVIKLQSTLWSPDFRSIEEGYTDSTASNVTSTTGVRLNARGGDIGSFVAPHSGIVTAHFSALLKSPGAGIYISVGVILRTGGVAGSGTIVGGNFVWTEGAESYNPNYTTCSNWKRFTGLTRGDTYNMVMVVAVQSGTGSVARGRLLLTQDF